MHIIIAGAGRVGFRLAKALSIRHNVAIMDKNKEALNRLQENIDILPIVGNIQDPDSYEYFFGKDIDLFIAVADVDEINLIASIIVDEKIKVKRKIIRLRNQFFAGSSIAAKIGITEAVFPFNLTATSVKALLDYPKANNVKNFAETSMKLISVRANFHHDIPDIIVEQINSTNIVVVGIERKKSFHIPKNSDSIEHDDMVYLFGEHHAIENLCKRFNHYMPKTIKRIIIFGADMLGVEIAKSLVDKNVSIKIIEKDIEKCKKAAKVLHGNVTVINSQYGDARLYEGEGLKNADMLIASTANDEENIIKCIEAKEHGIEKVVAINNDIEYYNLMHSLDIIVVRGPKTNAYYSIMEIIGSSSAVNEKLFCGGSAICFIRDFKKESRLIKPLIKRDIISYIISSEGLTLFNKAIIPDESSIVISFCVRDKEEKVQKWINDL